MLTYDGIDILIKVQLCELRLAQEKRIRKHLAARLNVDMLQMLDIYI